MYNNRAYSSSRRILIIITYSNSIAALHPMAHVPRQELMHYFYTILFLYQVHNAMETTALTINYFKFNFLVECNILYAHFKKYQSRLKKKTDMILHTLAYTRHIKVCNANTSTVHTASGTSETSYQDKKQT